MDTNTWKINHRRNTGLGIFTIVLVLTVLISGCSNNENSSLTTTEISNSEEISEDEFITLAELSSHKDISDCWVAHGKYVFDISEYVANNPDLASSCGTVGFESVVDSKNIDFADVESTSLYMGDLNE